jgi:hypothetical protein
MSPRGEIAFPMREFSAQGVPTVNLSTELPKLAVEYSDNKIPG